MLLQKPFYQFSGIIHDPPAIMDAKRGRIIRCMHAACRSGLGGVQAIPLYLVLAKYADGVSW